MARSTNQKFMIHLNTTLDIGKGRINELECTLEEVI